MGTGLALLQSPPRMRGSESRPVPCRSDCFLADQLVRQLRKTKSRLGAQSDAGARRMNMTQNRAPAHLEEICKAF